MRVPASAPERRLSVFEESETVGCTAYRFAFLIKTRRYSLGRASIASLVPTTSSRSPDSILLSGRGVSMT